MEPLRTVVSEEDHGRLIKYYLRSTFGISYGTFSKLKYMNGIRVNGVQVRANYVLQAGDCIEADLPDEGNRAVIEEKFPVSFAYRDDDLMIIDKPAPLACQCSEKQPVGTLENRLVSFFSNDRGYVYHPVNRLDKGTSGLMAAGMHAYSTALMQKQMHSGTFYREYLAIVEGLIQGDGCIDMPIAKAEGATIRRIVASNGKPARTHYRAIMHGGGRTLLRLQLETGRTHQIRVHLSTIGHPVAGDFLYGSELQSLPGRFALHSHRIVLSQPRTGARIECVSPLPQELYRLLE